MQQDECVASIETDKVDIPVNAPESGTLIETYAKAGDEVAKGQDLYSLELEATPKAAKGRQQAPPLQEEPKKQQPAPLQQPAPAPQPSSQRPQTPAAADRSESRVAMSRMRLKIAAKMKESQQTAASLTTFNEVDMSALIGLRAKYKELVLKRHGVKLGFMSAFVKAAAIGLAEFPTLNARIEGSEIVYSSFADISVAVATPKGLVTPVLRNCNALPMLEIERQIAQYGAKAREGRIEFDELVGGTFTISNGGVFGSLSGTPIINAPQAAILGMHAIKERPAVVDGKIEARPMMSLALTYDHRLIDGREAVLFLCRVKELLEEPLRFLIDV